MTGQIAALILGALLFLLGVFFSRKTQKDDGKVLDLTQKINENKQKAAVAQSDADKKVKEYQDALKAYDPDFHSDDGDGTPSS